MYSHTGMRFQTSSKFLVRNLSGWKIYLCWLISRSSLQSLTSLVQATFLLKVIMLLLTKITYCRDGQLICLECHFE